MRALLGAFVATLLLLYPRIADYLSEMYDAFETQTLYGRLTYLIFFLALIKILKSLTTKRPSLASKSPFWDKRIDKLINSARLFADDSPGLSSIDFSVAEDARILILELLDALSVSLERGKVNQLIQIIYLLDDFSNFAEKYSESVGDAEWFRLAITAKISIVEAINIDNNMPIFLSYLGSKDTKKLFLLYFATACHASKGMLRIGRRQNGNRALAQLYKAEEWCKENLLDLDKLHNASSKGLVWVDSAKLPIFRTELSKILVQIGFEISSREKPEFGRLRREEAHCLLEELSENSSGFRSKEASEIIAELEKRSLPIQFQPVTDRIPLFTSGPAALAEERLLKDTINTEKVDSYLEKMKEELNKDEMPLPVHHSAHKISVANAFLSAAQLPHFEKKKVFEYAQKSAVLYAEALRVRNRAFSPWQFAQNSLHRGLALYILLKGKQYTDSFDLANEVVKSILDSLTVFDPTTNPREYIVAHKTLASSYYLIGKHRLATRSANSIIAVFPKMLMTADSKDHQNLLLSLFSGVGDIGALSYLRMGHKQKAAITCEMGKKVFWREFTLIGELLEKGVVREYRRRLSKIEELREKFAQNLYAAKDSSKSYDRLMLQKKRKLLSEIELVQSEIEDLLEQYGIKISAKSHEKKIRKALESSVLPNIYFFGSEMDYAYLILMPARIKPNSSQHFFVEQSKAESLSSLLAATNPNSWFNELANFRKILGSNEFDLVAGASHWNSFVEETLNVLWQSLMHPLSSNLKKLGVDPDQIVQLIPSGQLSMLPLHASGEKRLGKWDCFFDRSVPVYLPSILHQCQARDNKLSLGKTALAITDPDPIPISVFGNPIEELDAWNVTSLTGPNATVANVEKALESASSASFICHAHWNPVDPDQSCIQLSDGPLTVKALKNSRFRNKPFVALGACESAAIGIGGQEHEAIGFPSSFLEGGAAGVTAALWPVLNTATDSVYREMFSEYSREKNLTMAAAYRMSLKTNRDGNFYGSANTGQGIRAFLTDKSKIALRNGEKEDEKDVQDLDSPIQPMNWACFAFYGNV